MNLDNTRLREIQMEKQMYANLLDKSETISDCIYYHDQLKELESEEIEILKRCKVEICPAEHTKKY